MAEATKCPRCAAQILIERGKFGQVRELNATGGDFHYVDCAGGKEAVEQRRRDVATAESRPKTGTR